VKHARHSRNIWPRYRRCARERPSREGTPASGHDVPALPGGTSPRRLRKVRLPALPVWIGWRDDAGRSARAVPVRALHVLAPVPAVRPGGRKVPDGGRSVMIIFPYLYVGVPVSEHAPRTPRDHPGGCPPCSDFYPRPHGRTRNASPLSHCPRLPQFQTPEVTQLRAPSSVAFHYTRAC